MNKTRRTILTGFGATLTAWTAGLLRPAAAFASDWNKAAFGAKNPADALKGLGYANPEPSSDIVLEAPEIAENGAVVPIEVTARIAGVQSVTVMVDKNPSPMVGVFEFSGQVEPYVATRIKMGQSSPVRVFVKAGGRTYTASKDVKVTVGGCGG